MVIAISLLSLYLAISSSSTLVALLLQGYALVTRFFPGVILGLFWKRVCMAGVFAGIVTGCATVAFLVLNKQDPFFGWSAGFLAVFPPRLPNRREDVKGEYLTQRQEGNQTRSTDLIKGFFAGTSPLIARLDLTPSNKPFDTFSQPGICGPAQRLLRMPLLRPGKTGEPVTDEELWCLSGRRPAQVHSARASSSARFPCGKHPLRRPASADAPPSGGGIAETARRIYRDRLLRPTSITERD